jgi:hypothetical protein
MLDVPDRVVGRDRHPADGVEHFGRRHRRVLVGMGWHPVLSLYPFRRRYRARITHQESVSFRVLPRIRVELGLAALRAEIIRFARVLTVPRGGARIDLHSTHHIFFHRTTSSSHDGRGSRSLRVPRDGYDVLMLKIGQSIAMVVAVGSFFTAGMRTIQSSGANASFQVQVIPPPAGPDIAARIS